MPASAQYLIDVASVISNGPSAATLALAIVAGGPIMDYIGNSKLLQLKLQEADVLLNAVKTATDSGDTSLTQINAVLAALEHTGSPSTTLIAAIETVVTNGPTAATSAKAIAAGGPIMDYIGNTKLVRLKLKECKNLVTQLLSATDGSDGSKTLITNLGLGLV